MRKFQGADAARSSGGIFGKSDAIKLAVMSGLLLVVGIAWAISAVRAKSLQDEERAAARGDNAFSEQVYVPTYDFEALDSRVDDGAEGRLLVEGDVLQEVLDYAALLTEVQFQALGAQEPDAERLDAMVADPAAQRGAPLRVRGRIVELHHRQPLGGREWYEGRIELPDRGPVFFATRRLDEDPDTGEALGEGTFARVDGVFLKPYRSGEILAPFIVGATAVRSYESVGRIETLPADIVASIESDSMERGIASVSPLANWTFLAYARDLPPGSIDWDAAPELDNAGLAALYRDPEAFVGKPFRIPVSKNMGTYAKAIPENPARLETMVTGWIGNATWSAGNGVIRFDAPTMPAGLRDGNLVRGRGFFMRNHFYESAKRGPALAPHFVLSELEVFVPQQSNFVGNLLLGVAAMTVALIALFVWLLTKDRKKSAELQQKLVERRRARRTRQAGASGA